MSFVTVGVHYPSVVLHVQCMHLIKKNINRLNHNINVLKQPTFHSSTEVQTCRNRVKLVFLTEHRCQQSLALSREPE